MSDPPSSGAPASAQTPDDDSSEPAPEAAKSPPQSAWKKFTSRLFIAHMVAYPVGFLAAVACMPMSLLARGDELLNASATGATNKLVRESIKNLGLDPTEAAQVQIVMEFVFIVAGGLWILVHFWGVPWARAAAKSVEAHNAGDLAGAKETERRGLKWFAWSTAATVAVTGLVGLGGWIWLFTL